MKVKSLKNTDLNTIVDCLLLSFADYFVPLPSDVELWRQRWKGARVDYELSFGMFDEDKLVGFIIHGIDEVGGELYAFNTGTGVIPEYRGKKITQKIYDHAIAVLKERGFNKCTLEVIQANEKAIHVYESIGFAKYKNYKCFKGELDVKTASDIELKKLSYKDINWEQIPHQEYYSWDHTKEALHAGKDNYGFYKVLEDNEELGFFAVNNLNGLVAQIELLSDNSNNWPKIFKGITQVRTTIKINNIDVRLVDKVNAVASSGLENSIDQYEMIMEI